MALSSADKVTFWKEHVEKHKLSNLSQKAYANQQGFPVSQFVYWIHRLKPKKKTDADYDTSSAFTKVIFPKRSSEKYAYQIMLENRNSLSFDAVSNSDSLKSIIEILKAI